MAHANRASLRGVSPVEGAIGFAILGSILAVAIPAFVRDFHSSRFVEPASGLARLGASAVAEAQPRPADDAFPKNAPLTPSAPPRGTAAPDPPGAWDHPTWTALAFRPVPEGVPHAFAFGFDSTTSPGKSTFVAHAHGDLDGDGVMSTFEVRGHKASGDPEAALDPGMYVEAELE